MSGGAESVATAVALGLVELGVTAVRQQMSARETALAAVKLAAAHVPELVPFLDPADRARIDIAAEVAAVAELGFGAPKP